ncbi:MAG: peptidase [Cytophagales bacterium]|nr:peptidase [Cytophagales bacterium]
MTYCLGIRTKSGIVGLADTRITSGSETTTAKKIFTVNREKHSFFIMTSGLRSVRDKALTYFREVIEKDDASFSKLYEAVNKFAEQVKRVAEEDKASLLESGMGFNLYSIVGGQLEEDAEPKIYLLYPQGNWIEVGENTPYVIIGSSGFGNPILRRSLTFESSLDFALKSAFLSFDATRISANDVDYPIDTIIMRNNTYHMMETRFEEKELWHISEFWNSRLREAIAQLPTEALDKAFQKMNLSRGAI